MVQACSIWYCMFLMGLAGVNQHQQTADCICPSLSFVRHHSRSLNRAVLHQPQAEPRIPILPLPLPLDPPRINQTTTGSSGGVSDKVNEVAQCMIHNNQTAFTVQSFYNPIDSLERFCPANMSITHSNLSNRRILVPPVSNDSTVCVPDLLKTARLNLSLAVEPTVSFIVIFGISISSDQAIDVETVNCELRLEKV